MSRIVDPAKLASRYRQEIREVVSGFERPLVLAGLLASTDKASMTYADYTRAACRDAGIVFDLRQVERLGIEAAIEGANQDPQVTGIIIYYPVFGTGQDHYLKDLVDYRKDIEGLSTHWIKKLHANDRYIGGDKHRKSLLPCTPLAIIKLLTEAGIMAGDHPLKGKHVVIFNRSEVVGRPLARMLANDGARVVSFDIDGPIVFEGHCVGETTMGRKEALAQADIVITGVPNKSFPLIEASEIREGAIGVNFSTFRNFSTEAKDKCAVFVPRVGPMTVTMALRNTLRVHRNFHDS